jgi:hypothetical protein
LEELAFIAEYQDTQYGTQKVNNTFSQLPGVIVFASNASP